MEFIEIHKMSMFVWNCLLNWFRHAELVSASHVLTANLSK